MFCKKCGAKLAENSKFCTSCGNSIEDVKTTTNDKKPAVQASNNAKLYKILAYIGFLFVIGMCVQEKDDKSVRFHVGQGILAFIVNIAITLINNLIVFNIFKTETWFGITEVSGT